MNELVERYVHQVGRYLPQKERAEIEAELRSQIQDQLDDRYGESPSPADVAAVLAEFGDPRKIAVSYGGEQYLVGPDLYPSMMMVLRHGWVLVPAIVVFLNVFGVLVSSQQTNLIGLFIETLIAVVQATLIFSAVVVLIFAILQHSGTELKAKEQPFNPLDLPQVDDPASVDRVETTFGAAFGTFVMLVFLYFANVGGLTLRFNLSDPGEVIPVPMVWMVLFIVTGCAQLILNLLVLHRNRWSVGLLLTQTILELFGIVCLYFVVFEPIYQRLIVAAPQLANVPFLSQGPEIIAASMAIVTLLGDGAKLIRLWNYRHQRTLPITIQTVG